MNTKRLFKEDVYMRESKALITGIANIDNKTLITLDQTIFFPTGGGQSCDLGKLAGFDVLGASTTPLLPSPEPLVLPKFTLLLIDLRFSSGRLIFS